MKKISTIIGFFLAGFLLWYLIIKPYDYLVTFKVKTTVGTINQSIKLWNTSLENSSPIQQDNFANLTQQIKIKDSTYNYEWSLSRLNDSITKVKVYVTDLNNSLANKISIPFSKTDFEKQTIKTVSNFTENLLQHLKKIRVTIEGKSSTRSVFCAFIPMKSLQKEKARGMIQNYSLLNSFLSTDNIKMNGTPFIEVTNWNIENDSIAYNFCFPIIKNDSLPKHSLIQYKQYNQVTALKAVYNGNYITSDRAWYALLDYAKQNNIAVNNNPVEVFYNNPNYGGDEMRWKADIYMPIKE